MTRSPSILNQHIWVSTMLRCWQLIDFSHIVRLNLFVARIGIAIILLPKLDVLTSGVSACTARKAIAFVAAFVS
jgi:hypothetical protein